MTLKLNQRYEVDEVAIIPRSHLNGNDNGKPFAVIEVIKKVGAGTTFTHTTMTQVEIKKLFNIKTKKETIEII